MKRDSQESSDISEATHPCSHLPLASDDCLRAFTRLQRRGVSVEREVEPRAHREEGRHAEVRRVELGVVQDVLRLLPATHAHTPPSPYTHDPYPPHTHRCQVNVVSRHRRGGGYLLSHLGSACLRRGTVAHSSRVMDHLTCAAPTYLTLSQLALAQDQPRKKKAAKQATIQHEERQHRKLLTRNSLRPAS